MRDELRHRVSGEIRRHHQHGRRVGEKRDRCQIGQRIECELAVERMVGREPDARHHQAMAVGRRFHHLQRAGVGVAAGTIERDERLPEPLAEAFGNEPRQKVGTAAGRERHDELDRSRRIGLRLHRGGNAREEQKRREAKPQHRGVQRPSAFAITCSQRWFSSSYNAPDIALRANSDGTPAMFQRHGKRFCAFHQSESWPT